MAIFYRSFCEYMFVIPFSKCSEVESLGCGRCMFDSMRNYWSGCSFTLQHCFWIGFPTCLLFILKWFLTHIEVAKTLWVSHWWHQDPMITVEWSKQGCWYNAIKWHILLWLTSFYMSFFSCMTLWNVITWIGWCHYHHNQGKGN